MNNQRIGVTNITPFSDTFACYLQHISRQRCPYSLFNRAHLRNSDPPKPPCSQSHRVASVISRSLGSRNSGTTPKTGNPHHHPQSTTYPYHHPILNLPIHHRMIPRCNHNSGHTPQRCMQASIRFTHSHPAAGRQLRKDEKSFAAQTRTRNTNPSHFPLHTPLRTAGRKEKEGLRE